MAIDRTTAQYLTRLSTSLRREPLSPEQIRALSSAVKRLPANTKLTENEVDAIAKDLNLPKAHRATLIFSIVAHQNAGLIHKAREYERGGENGLAGVIEQLLWMARQRDGSEVALALKEFVAGFAGDSAAIKGTGFDIF